MHQSWDRFLQEEELSVRKLNLFLQCQCSHTDRGQAADNLLLISVHKNRLLNINYNWKIPSNLKHLESVSVNDDDQSPAEV